MAFATGSEHQIAIIPEVTFGTVPTTPAFDVQRHTSCSLSLAKSALVSQELRVDRNIQGVRHGNFNVAGEIGFELSRGAQDDLIEACLQGTWAADILKNGVTDRSFTMERLFSDITQYERFDGCKVNTMALSIAPDAIVTGTFGISGSGLTVDQAIVTGATYVAATTEEVFDSFTGTILEGGGAIAVITAIELNIDNGMDPAYAVGSAAALEILAKQCMVTGTVSAWFQDEVMLEKFVNETETSIDFTLTRGALTMQFVLPALKYTGGDTPTQGPGGVVINMPFQAYYDETETCTIKVVRST